MSVNLVVIDGIVKSLALTYDPQGKPELRFTLEQTDQGPDGKAWRSYWPCCASGATAERLANVIEDGQHIVVTSGKLCYRKRQTKTGEQSRMEILVWQIDTPTTLAPPAHEVAPEYATEGAPPERSHEAASVPETKQGKPRYPKWRPEPTRPQGANRVRTLFTSVGNAADRVGPA